jgi:MFS family permease
MEKPETNKNDNDSVQPPKMTFLSLITRTAAGLGGGIAGTFILLIIYILSVSVIAPVLTPSENGAEVSPLFIFVLMGMIFASTLAANIFAPLFISFTERERYKRVTTSLFQIFIINVVVFLILVPVYLFSQGFSLEFISYAAGLHIAFSVLASALVFEILSEYKYAILGVYSTIFAVLAGISLNIMLYQATGTATILLFIALPVLWGGIGFVHGIILMLYNWIVSTWGTDYLATTQEYSKDYGIREDEQDIYVEDKPEDTEGVEFLKKK